MIRIKNKGVIAVSGKPGAGTSTIARKLAERLGLKYFSPGQKFFKPSKQVDDTHEALEKWKTREGSSKEFHEKIDYYQKELAKKRNVVICGKLSIWVLKDLADVKIWIDCFLDERVRRTARRDKISFEEAKHKITERERIETEEWKRMYGINRSDQCNMADIVVDSTNLTREETLNTILKRIKTISSR